jgi:hypothetical protein
MDGMFKALIVLAVVAAGTWGGHTIYTWIGNIRAKSMNLTTQSENDFRNKRLNPGLNRWTRRDDRDAKIRHGQIDGQ